MSRVVWKFPLPLATAWLSIPLDAEIIHVGIDGRDLCVWAICDRDAPLVQRWVGAFNTGRPLPRHLVASLATGEARFLGSAMMPSDEGPNGVIVWHVFESTGVSNGPA
jgi:hypothetical protein